MGVAFSLRGLCFPRSPSAPETPGLPLVPLRDWSWEPEGHGGRQDSFSRNGQRESPSLPLDTWRGARHFLGPMLAGQTISDALQEMTHVTCPSHTVESSRACRTQGTGPGPQTAVVAAAEGQRWPNVTQHMGLLITGQDSLTPSCDNQPTRGPPSKLCRGGRAGEPCAVLSLAVVLGRFTLEMQS